MKILHAADFHLDAPFAGLSPERGAQRREEGRKLLGRLARLAGEEEVDLVLLAGDLFDGDTVYRDTLTALKEALASIPAPVLIAPGNHDPFTPHSPYAATSWPEHVTIFSEEEVSSKSFPALGCVVHGVGFTHTRVGQDLLAGFRAPQDGRIHLGIAHSDLGQSSSPYGPMALQTVAASRLHYLALGHIHLPSGLQKSGETAWAYPGCPEGHGFDELGDRGCLLVRVEAEGVTAQFRPLALRRYLEVTADTTGTTPLEAAEEALSNQSREDCIKLIFTGESASAPDLEGLGRALEGKAFALRLVDHTRPSVDRSRQAREDTLIGAFLRAMEAHPEAGSDRVALALRFGLTALEKGEDCRP